MSPVVMYLRHSMMVCTRGREDHATRQAGCGLWDAGSDWTYSLAATIVADDDRERMEELDHIDLGRIEGAA
jgi:hypothetical protein